MALVYSDKQWLELQRYINLSSLSNTQPKLMMKTAEENNFILRSYFDVNRIQKIRLSHIFISSYI